MRETQAANIYKFLEHVQQQTPNKIFLTLDILDNFTRCIYSIPTSMPVW